jgi:predicted enzyme related to lactoylglutathione lyase
MSLGHVGWHELYTDDVEKAFDFYAAKFGWTKGEAMDMGPMGVYQLFAATAAMPIGGMMKRPPNIPQPFWNYYFTVAELDATLAKVEKAGGKVVHGPTEVPGGAWIAQCFDPQDAFFSLLAAKR